MTAPTAPEAPATDRARISFVNALREARDRVQPPPLAEVVQTNLLNLWVYGGRNEQTAEGRRPEWIYIRPRFVVRPPNGPAPALSRLIKSKGLQLRLLLLMIFDAQCRYGPDELVRNVRWVASHPNEEEYEPWQQLVLSETFDTKGTGRRPESLRARQITEAMRVLDEQHLLKLPRYPGGNRRRYNPDKDGRSWHLLSEANTAEAQARYAVPQPSHRDCLQISRHFFTDLWLFALTDVELATYLTLLLLRSRFPDKHGQQGVYLRADHRQDHFRLTRTAWRATERLHRFRLINRARDPRRNFRTGNVGNRDTRWANRQVMPALFKINDAALKWPALDTIHQVLTAPTDEDKLRRESGQEAVEEAAALALPSPSDFLFDPPSNTAL